ncbi:cation-transporting P-type ATPase [Roseateles sp.]
MTARRLLRDGANELRGAARVSAWRRVLFQFRHPLA